jgi:signal transduction histidine kinase
MEIRRKITFQFIVTVAFIILLSSSAIYVSFSESRQEEFYDRLSQKARLVAQMLIEIDEIDTDLLRKIEQNNPLSLPNEKIKIYNYSNQLIYVSDTVNNFIYPPELINKARLENEISFRRGKSEVVGLFYTGQFDRIVVFVAATDIFGVKKLNHLRMILIIVFFVSLVIVFASGRIFANRSLHPIISLIKEVDSIEATDLSVRLNTGNGKDEIARLAKTFNRLLYRLESAFAMQKNFIANASHELRTPLTVLSGQLEVLLRKERDNTEYKKTVLSTFEEIKNLSDISNRLLLLAHASSEASRINFSPCRVDDMIWQAQSELKKRHAHYKIQVIFSDEFDSQEKLIIEGNDLLLETAFLNLMDNACKYSKTQTCTVQLQILSPGKISILFEDNGIGISEQDIKNIFQPFYRSKDVINLKGHGIGLSLVEKIAAMHKGTVHVKSEYGKGSVFTLTFVLIS